MIQTNTIFRIQGYFIDDNSPIDSLVCAYDNVPDCLIDDDIFFFGLSENDIQTAIASKEPVSNEFIITAYTPESF